MFVIMSYANVSCSDDTQIKLIKQAMDADDRLKAMYGDSMAKIEANSK